MYVCRQYQNCQENTQNYDNIGIKNMADLKLSKKHTKKRCLLFKKNVNIKMKHIYTFFWGYKLRLNARN
jgi:hypothetical protein